MEGGNQGGWQRWKRKSVEGVKVISVERREARKEVQGTVRVIYDAPLGMKAGVEREGEAEEIVI